MLEILNLKLSRRLFAKIWPKILSSETEKPEPKILGAKGASKILGTFVYYRAAPRLGLHFRFVPTFYFAFFTLLAFFFILRGLRSIERSEVFFLSFLAAEPHAFYSQPVKTASAGAQAAACWPLGLLWLYD